MFEHPLTVHAMSYLPKDNEPRFRKAEDFYRFPPK
jgi:hypothetical protein